MGINEHDKKVQTSTTQTGRSIEFLKGNFSFSHRQVWIYLLVHATWEDGTGMLKTPEPLWTNTQKQLQVYRNILLPRVPGWIQTHKVTSRETVLGLVSGFTAYCRKFSVSCECS
ncbi:hypothetical protein XENORESO_012484 [Xenotaenia resolanae]|uniref:Transposase n=1 Tax=Xenotaenia resolanae TaxID=208358 RepID=A0ABV0W9M5_9TELE